ncbi:regulation of nuclear pre-mRNA domain-containing protein 1B [Monomorium pharaonis]|uniref:regulation of nuclear pre-mRNA domain-containing protein 1B n=1 Tax=Monomorium pharaonis TaxID=307658 RepID=UPI00063FA052|nr:regulation of nuclear pre-mRNA domain-containing protein 1B [Monomorium pharaonis]
MCLFVHATTTTVVSRNANSVRGTIETPTKASPTKAADGSRRSAMTGFTESALVKRLMDLNPSQQSIQTLSLWLIHHRKHHPTIVKIWFKEMCKVKDHRKLMFMYLANDVIQNSKKKGPEFGKEFETVLPKAFEHMKGFDEKTRERLNRLLQIWEERGVYDKAQIAEFKVAFAESEKDSIPPPKKKAKIEVEKLKKEKKERKKSETEVEVDGTKELHVTLSPRTPGGDPPETEELIKALMDLENTASSDAGVRERIASLPPEVSEVSLLANLADRTAADQLSAAVNEAAALLADYNGRLQAEMEDRRRLLTMLRDYTLAQRQLLQQAQSTLEDYKEKLKKVCAVRSEVKSHISNLPDLTQLPDVTGGLAPLPSAGDLFSMH